MWFLLAAVASLPGSAAADHAALERMARGDHEALAELYDRHGRLVFSLALRILRDQSDAEDIVQDVFSQAWRQAVDEQIALSTEAARIRAAVDELSVLQRVAIELAFYEGLTHVEIAERLELPLGTVKTRIRQGLLKLKERLAGAT